MPKTNNGRRAFQQGPVQQVARPVAAPRTVSAPKLPKRMPSINTTKVQSLGEQADPMQLASSVVSGVLQEVKKKKKNKKKKLFSKIGDFLDGALNSVMNIAPGIIHSLANNVTDDWSQGSHTKKTLLMRARSLQKEQLASTVPRAPEPSSGASGPVFVVSKRNVDLHPTLASNLKAIGVQMTPLPNTSFSAPVTSGMKMSSSFRMSGVNHKTLGAGLRIMGADYIDDVITNGTEGRGVLKAEVDLNPARWDGTRIARYAAMYERFEINSLSMVYTPACSTATNGSLVGWFDYDPTDDAGESRDTVVRAIGSIGQDNSPVWAGHAAHFKRDPEQFDYYVDPDGSDDRLTSAGTYRLNVLSGVSTVAGSAYGTLTMVYDVSFFVPSIQQALPGPGPEYKCLVDNATSSAATPCGTAPSVDTDNTMELDYQVLSPSGSGFSGWQGSKSMPASYLGILNFFAAAGLTGVTVSGGTSVTFLSGAAPASAVVNAGGTQSYQIVIFTVNAPLSDDPSQSYIKITGSGAALTGGSVRFFRVPAGVQLKRMTLQDYERKTLDMAEKLDQVCKVVTRFIDNDKSILPSPGLSRAMPPLPDIEDVPSAARIEAIRKIRDLVSKS